MDIRIADPTSADVRALLDEHLASMRALSPPESVHALDVTALQQPAITFWGAWDGDVLVGCGALKALSASEGEVKSMCTSTRRRRQGVGRAMLNHIVETARRRGYERLSLETGTVPAFAPAHRLYEQFGFGDCGPFDGYRDDANSRFMTLALVG